MKLPKVVEKPLIGSARITPIDAARQRQHQRFQQERHHHCARTETQRAQRADFRGARGDRRVHRVHRAENRADRHDAATTIISLRSWRATTAWSL